MLNNTTLSQTEKAEKFKSLHERESAFVIPNPWDLGSARLLAGLGFEALATTSAGFANSLGRLDGEVSLDEVIAHCRSLCAATDLPISADLENCFADEPEKVAATVLAAAQAGLIGGSIEDYTGDPLNPIYEFALAVERVHAAAEAAHSLDFPFTLTARARICSMAESTLTIQFAASSIRGSRGGCPLCASPQNARRSSIGHERIKKAGQRSCAVYKRRNSSATG